MLVVEGLREGKVARDKVGPTELAVYHHPRHGYNVPRMLEAMGQLRWRIEEAFKRIKHRLALEHLTGISWLAYRRISTVIEVVTGKKKSLIDIDPSDLDAALEKDKQPASRRN